MIKILFPVLFCLISTAAHAGPRLFSCSTVDSIKTPVLVANYDGINNQYVLKLYAPQTQVPQSVLRIPTLGVIVERAQGSGVSAFTAHIPQLGISVNIRVSGHSSSVYVKSNDMNIVSAHAVCSI